MPRAIASRYRNETDDQKRLAAPEHLVKTKLVECFRQVEDLPWDGIVYLTPNLSDWGETTDCMLISDEHTRYEAGLHPKAAQEALSREVSCEILQSVHQNLSQQIERVTFASWLLGLKHYLVNDAFIQLDSARDDV